MPKVESVDSDLLTPVERLDIPSPIRCPVCKQDDVAREEFRYAPLEYVVQTVMCRCCGAVWNEVSAFAFVELIARPVEV